MTSWHIWPSTGPADPAAITPVYSMPTRISWILVWCCRLTSRCALPKKPPLWIDLTLGNRETLMRFPCLRVVMPVFLVLGTTSAIAEEPSTGEKTVKSGKNLRSPKDVFRTPVRRVKRQGRRLRGGFGSAAPVHWRPRERRRLRGAIRRKRLLRNWKPRRKVPQSSEFPSK